MDSREHLYRALLLLIVLSVGVAAEVRAGPSADAIMDKCKEDAEHYGEDYQPPFCADRAPWLRQGQLCRLRIDEVHPTQSSVGMVAVKCMAAKMESESESKNKEMVLRDYFAIVPLVVGPGDRFYIIDRHHVASALLLARQPEKRKVLYACVNENWRNKSTKDFWETMIQSSDPKMVWLKDDKGNPIEPAQLPETLSALRNDPYRTLSAWVRDSHGYINCSTIKEGSKPKQCQENLTPYFLEFYWADFLRKQVPIDNIYTENYEVEIAELVNHFCDAMHAALSPAARAELGVAYGYNESTGFPGMAPNAVRISAKGCELSHVDP